MIIGGSMEPFKDLETNWVMQTKGFWERFGKVWPVCTTVHISFNHWLPSLQRITNQERSLRRFSRRLPLDISGPCAAQVHLYCSAGKDPSAMPDSYTSRVGIGQPTPLSPNQML